MNVLQKLQLIQLELKAPKKQRNKFGNYNYRSAEDILEAVKPYAKKHGVLFKITEELVSLNDSLVTVVSTAKCLDVETMESIESVGTAIIDFETKGMQMPQRTGAASSYAKKYALGNLLLLDDTKDSDATNTHDKKPNGNKPIVKQKKEVLDNKHPKYDIILKYLEENGDVKKVTENYEVKDKEIISLINKNK